jgi:hypothetical protein
MRLHPTHHILAVLLGFLLSACGTTATSTDATALPTAERATATVAATPTAPPAQTPTAQPTATPAPAATAAPTAAPLQTPTLAPSPTPAPVVIQALYLCKFGFCRYTLGDLEAEELITALDPSLHGYAFRPDGAGLVYADEMYPTGETEILITSPDRMDTHSVTKISGVPSGAGGLEGYGVLGMTADGQRVLFEDQAQLFVADIDGSRRHAVMDQRPYGASSTHAYALSPSGLRVLYTRSGNPNYFEIADVDTQELQTYTLAANQRAVALVDDDQVLIERFEPPFEVDGDNPAGVLRWSLGYEVVSIGGATLGEPKALRADDGSFARSIISNVSGDWVLVRDDVPRAGDDTPEWPDPLWLLNVKTGARQEIHLPYYDNISPVAIRVVR